MSYQIIAIAGLFYILAVPLYLIYILTRNKKLGYIATGALTVGALIHTYGFIKRFLEMYDIYHSFMRSIPFSNLYESLVFFALCLIIGYIFIEWRYKNKTFGVFVSIVAGIILGLTEVLGITKEVQPLVPALKSNWLLAHVSLSFIAYAAFAISFITALLHIIISSVSKRSFNYILSTTLLGLMSFIFVSIMIDIASGGNPNSLKIFHSTLKNSSTLISIVSWLSIAVFVIVFWKFGGFLGKILNDLKIDSNFLEDLTYKSIAFVFLIFTIG